MLFCAAACGLPTAEADVAAPAEAPAEAPTVTTVISGVENPADTQKLLLDDQAWRYNETSDVYWQADVPYCATPAAEKYETMSIFVPGSYFSAVANGDGTFSCTVSHFGAVGEHTALHAPVVMLFDSADGAAVRAPLSYDAAQYGAYLEAGMIVAVAGCRGIAETGGNAQAEIDCGAPWGAVAGKAAVRYLRYNAARLPGGAEDVFVCGMGAGGAVSAVLGASGDSVLYDPYLAAIGAAMLDQRGNYISDAVSGVVAWCPAVHLDYADEAAEWMMGQYLDTGAHALDTWTAALSDDMSRAYAGYVNGLGLTDAGGNPLQLSETAIGLYADGAYYDALLETIRQSFNRFLSDTAFPCSIGTQYFETADDYIAFLNDERVWIQYASEADAATMTDIGAFVRRMLPKQETVALYDRFDRAGAYNRLFGVGGAEPLHFNPFLTMLLSDNADRYKTYADYDASVAMAYAADLSSTDALGKTVTERTDMYNPLYFLLSGQEGFGAATVSPYWRIRTGVEQTEAPLVASFNLFAALGANANVRQLDYAAVWAQGFVKAEQTGDAAENAIAWINACLAAG